MLRWACASLLIVAAGCGDVPELRFLGSDGGSLDGGDDAAGAVACGAITCINLQQPGTCNCGDCTNSLGCTGGKACCYDIHGQGSCKPEMSCH